MEVVAHEGRTFIAVRDNPAGLPGESPGWLSIAARGVSLLAPESPTVSLAPSSWAATAAQKLKRLRDRALRALFCSNRASLCALAAPCLVHKDLTAATTLPVWKADCSNRPSGLARTPRIVFLTNGLSVPRFSEPYLSQ
jgi:hypothetical protein